MLARDHPESLPKHDFYQRVDITEISSDQFQIWILNYGPYGQLRAVREDSSILLIVCYFWGLFFHVFMGIFFSFLNFTFVSSNFLVRILQCNFFQNNNFCPWKHEKTALKRCSEFTTNLFSVCTGLAAQEAHFRQKYQFNRLSVSPLYNLLEHVQFF